MNTEVSVLGVGHNTLLLIDMLEACGKKIRGLYHYEAGKTGSFIYDYPVLGSFDDLFSDDITNRHFALSMGDNEIRARLFDKITALGGSLINIIHPSAWVSSRAKLGCGVIIGANSSIHPDVHIGNNTMIGENVVITHSTKIGTSCLIAPGNVIGSYIELGDFVFSGLGAIYISGKVSQVGSRAVIGAGSVITKAIQSGQTIAGNPGRKL